MSLEKDLKSVKQIWWEGEDLFISTEDGATIRLDKAYFASRTEKPIKEEEA